MDYHLVLQSPCGSEPATYRWPLLPSESNEIYETIRLVCNDFPELSLSIGLNPERDVTSLCASYNNAIGLFQLDANFAQTPSEELLNHIMKQVYKKSVVNPERLNQYTPFSPEVYGEVTFDFISEMIAELNITDSDVFLDLGSGVGQVVLQVAASTQCKKSIGIEKGHVPCEYAEEMDKNFKFWMNFYGKTYREYKLLKGNFLSDEFKQTLLDSTVIFVNNLAFGSEVNNSLKTIFADVKDGTRIFSTERFCPQNFRITHRTLNDIAAIMDLRKITSLQNSVSWTKKPVDLFLHTIDRRKLEYFFQNAKSSKLEKINRKKKTEQETSE